ncbi:MAG TPA: autotransporter assembly complex family protein [Alphaproteobacteria bacterium]|jgi:translocation and assembly module TamA|nr:autotransporter assembly complex family protein [Alphaproteobacteria bacterium]
MVKTTVPSRNAKILRTLLFAAFLLMVGGIARADVPYEVTFQPTGDDDLDSAIEDASQLSALNDRPPDSDAALRSRAAADRERINAVARSFGYYDDQVEIEIDAKAQPAKVTVKVTPGPQYLLTSVSVVGPGGLPLPVTAPPLAPADLKLEIGKPALAAPVATGDSLVERIFQSHGFPFARIKQRKVTIDHGAHSMTVVYEVEPGHMSLFGDTKITGLESLDPGYVHNRILWQPGQPYDIGKVDKTRDALVATNLFSTVSIKPEQNDPPGVTPMLLDVSERLQHTIAATASYSSSDGFEIGGSWEHRNLFGGAEDLKVTAAVGNEVSALQVDFRTPDLFAVGWDLISSLGVINLDTDAFNATVAKVAAGVEYKAVARIAFGAQLSFERTTTNNYQVAGEYKLIGLPVYVKRDASDDLLNPTRGDRESITITPYTDPDYSPLTFVSGKVTGSVYQRLGDDDTYVFAASAAVGATFGVSLENLPPDKRFYAGGGGSVRGYAFQHAGPNSPDGDPRGGLSSIETSIELRYKLTQTIGLVPFIDAGNVYDSSLPDFGKKLFVGAGLGVRYYTGLGPVRLDIAVPLDKQKTDDSFQIYVSLGQAF